MGGLVDAQAAARHRFREDQGLMKGQAQPITGNGVYGA